MDIFGLHFGLGTLVALAIIVTVLAVLLWSDGNDDYEEGEEDERR